MITARETAPNPASPAPVAQKRRLASSGQSPLALSSIYQEETNIAIWQRDLDDGSSRGAGRILAAKQDLELARRVTPENTLSCLADALRLPGVEAFNRDVVELVDMFCCLFDLREVGLRLTALQRAMCPRFHVDNLPCRLVTTYCGPATQWLQHQHVERSRLGPGNQGKPDEESGIYSSGDDIQQLSIGDVALLKGELWEGNENAGLVHRSPAVPSGESRLLLTLDIIR